MSLDFPRYKTWLKLRNRRPPPPRMFHLSAALIPVHDAGGRLVRYDAARGVTYRKGQKPNMPAESVPLKLAPPEPVKSAVRGVLFQAKRTQK